ncbi:MBL fold metallo-hydrolase [Propionivibrio sp.]|uniref:MBL fold metallo-hydrolase n=1 Tax=Propionivibrio sp. TaxID=2212460 RepID=UPI00345AC69A
MPSMPVTFARCWLRFIWSSKTAGRPLSTPGPTPPLPSALAALEVLGLTPDCVDYVMLTHIHLDHAGEPAR